MPSNKTDELLRPGNVIRETWKVTRKLGEGGFGAVFEVVNKLTKERAAMKVECTSERNQVLKMEVAVLRRLQGKKHACRYHGCGRNDRFNYVVMSLVGQNLSELRKKAPFVIIFFRNLKFSYSTGLRLGKQCIEAIEELHDIGFLHRDVKPSNYAMGYDDLARTVLLLDFGLARQFVNKGEMRPERTNVGFRGTVRYASITTHIGKDMGRVDDLWSVIYMIVEFLLGGLPWRRLNGRQEVLAMKQATKPEELFKSLACKQDLLVITSHMTDLKYTEAPDYRMIFRQMDKCMEKCNAREDDLFDWEDEEWLKQQPQTRSNRGPAA